MDELKRLWVNAYLKAMENHSNSGLDCASIADTILINFCETFKDGKVNLFERTKSEDKVVNEYLKDNK